MRKKRICLMTVLLIAATISLLSCSADMSIKKFLGISEGMTEAERIIAAAGLYSVKNSLKAYDNGIYYNGVRLTERSLKKDIWTLSDVEFTDNLSFIKSGLGEQCIKVSGTVTCKYESVDGSLGFVIYRTDPSLIEISIMYEFYGQTHILKSKYKHYYDGSYSFTEFEMDGNSYILTDVNSMLTNATYLYTYTDRT